MKITPIRQPSMVTEMSRPKYRIGLKLEKSKTQKPATSVNEVKNMGIPEFIRALFIRSSSGRVCFVLENLIR